MKLQKLFIKTDRSIELDKGKLYKKYPYLYWNDIKLKFARLMFHKVSDKYKLYWKYKILYYYLYPYILLADYYNISHLSTLVYSSSNGKKVYDFEIFFNYSNFKFKNYEINFTKIKNKEKILKVVLDNTYKESYFRNINYHKYSFDVILDNNELENDKTLKPFLLLQYYILKEAKEKYDNYLKEIEEIKKEI